MTKANRIFATFTILVVILLITMILFSYTLPKDSKTKGLEVIDQYKSIKLPLGTNTLQVAYVIINHSEKPIGVKVASTSCGCTSASVQPAILTPKGQAQVIANVSPPSSGSKMITIDLKTTAIGQESIVLSLRIEGSAELPFVDHGTRMINIELGENGLTEEEFYLVTREAEHSNRWITDCRAERCTMRVISSQMTEQPYSKGVVTRHYSFRAQFRQLSPARLKDNLVNVGAIRFVTDSSIRPADDIVINMSEFELFKCSPRILRGRFHIRDERVEAAVLVTSQKEMGRLSNELEITYDKSLLDVEMQELKPLVINLKISARRPNSSPQILDTTLVVSDKLHSKEASIPVHFEWSEHR